MALNTLECNHLIPLNFKELTEMLESWKIDDATLRTAIDRSVDYNYCV